MSDDVTEPTGSQPDPESESESESESNQTEWFARATGVGSSLK